MQLRENGRIVVWLATYAVSVVLARQFLAPETGLALFWPAAGIATLWLLPQRPPVVLARDATLLFLVTASTLAATGTPAPSAAGFGLANVAQPLLFGLAWRRLYESRPGSLAAAAPQSARDVLLTVCCAGIAAACGSVLGVGTVALTGGATDGAVWLGWVVRNGSGIAVLVLTVTSMVSCSALPGGLRRFGVGQRAVGSELIAAGMASAVLTVGVFTDGAHRPVAFLALISAVWFGLRFSPGVAAFHGLLQGAVSVGYSLDGRGPFGRPEMAAERALGVQAFVLISVVIACLLSVSVAERRALLSQSRWSAVRAHEAATEARRRTALLEAITDGVREGLVVVGRGGRVVLSNAAAAEVLGTAVPTRIDLDGDTAVDGVLSADGRPLRPYDRPLVRALAGEVVSASDVVVLDPVTEARRVVSLAASPVDPTGDVADRLAVMVLRDVTGERSAFEELKAFAGVVAHDLKNPVAALMSWSEILDDQLDELDVDASHARATLLRIYATAERTEELVDDLLLYARAGAGDLDPRATPFRDLVAEALRQLPPQELALADVTVEIPEETTVTVDAVLVRQLLVNLLGNALKYADSQPVVRLSARAVNGRVLVEVADQGIGIPHDEQERVFEGFYRSSRTATQFPGTGLGLAICARAVRRHGGRIAATSGPSGGTIVTFTLPLSVSETASTVEQTAAVR